MTVESKICKTDQEWRQQLTPKQYKATRQKESEPPFSGKYYNTTEKGIYKCVCCGAELFSSETKYDSGTGWPSFWAPIDPEVVGIVDNYQFLMHQIEAVCNVCEAHLGYLFDDGPAPTYHRYSVNSASLRLVKQS